MSITNNDPATSETTPATPATATGAADLQSSPAAGTGPAAAATRATRSTKSTKAVATTTAATEPAKRFAITPEGGEEYAEDNVHVAFARAHAGDQVIDAKNGGKPYLEVLEAQQAPKKSAK